MSCTWIRCATLKCKWSDQYWPSSYRLCPRKRLVTPVAASSPAACRRLPCWDSFKQQSGPHNPAQATVGVLVSIGAFPWVIKPVYGFLSDSVPLFGYKRRSYLVACGLLGKTRYRSFGY